MKIFENAAVARELVRAYLTYSQMPFKLRPADFQELILNMWSIWLGKPLVGLPWSSSRIAARVLGEGAAEHTPRKRTPRKKATAAASGDGDPVTPQASGTGKEPEQAAEPSGSSAPKP